MPETGLLHDGLALDSTGIRASDPLPFPNGANGSMRHRTICEDWTG